MGVVDPKNDMKVGTVCHGMSYGCGAGAWGHALHEDECKTPLPTPACARRRRSENPRICCALTAPCGAGADTNKYTHREQDIEKMHHSYRQVLIARIQLLLPD